MQANYHEVPFQEGNADLSMDDWMVKSGENFPDHLLMKVRRVRAVHSSGEGTHPLGRVGPLLR